MGLKESLLEQIDAVFRAEDICRYETPRSEEEEYSRDLLWHSVNYSALAVIERITGAQSSLSEQARKAIERIAANNLDSTSRDSLLGMVRSLRDEVEAGYLMGAQTLIRAEIFGDLLEQAEYLLSEGYTNAAPVLCGSVLEAHLRNLCTVQHIDVTDTTGKPKKSSRLNDDLVKAKAYSALEQKEVTAWLAVRNSAAHGEHNQYDAKQVDLMVQGVRGFMARHPA